VPDASNFALHRPELTGTLERGDEKIARLMSSSAKVFSSGATIIRENTEHDLVYRMRTGWAGRVRTLPDGRSQFIMLFLPGDLFAVKSMFMTLHPDAIVALSDVSLEQIDHRKLREVYEQDADVATRCIWQVLEEERRLHNWVVGLGQGSADERMAQMLLEFRGRLIRSKVIAEDSREFRLPMTQQQIGGMLGITNVHVNRVLKGLREAEIVTIRDGKATFLNVAVLEKIAFPVQDPFERDVAS